MYGRSGCAAGGGDSAAGGGWRAAGGGGGAASGRLAAAASYASVYSDLLGPMRAQAQLLNVPTAEEQSNKLYETPMGCC